MKIGGSNAPIGIVVYRVRKKAIVNFRFGGGICDKYNSFEQNHIIPLRVGIGNLFFCDIDTILIQKYAVRRTSAWLRRKECVIIPRNRYDASSESIFSQSTLRLFGRRIDTLVFKSFSFNGMKHIFRILLIFRKA